MGQKKTRRKPKPSVKAFMDKWGWDWFDIDNVKHDEAEMRRDLLALLRDAHGPRPVELAAPDANCVSLPDGDCVGIGCMHDAPAPLKDVREAWAWKLNREDGLVEHKGVILVVDVPGRVGGPGYPVRVRVTVEEIE